MMKKSRGGRRGREVSQYRPYRTAVFVGACVALSAALLVVLRVGNPICVRHMLRLPRFFPPTWFLFMCGGFSYLSVGGVLGRGGWCLCSAHYLPVRGLIFLVGFVLLRLCWYPLFFGVLAPLAACGVLAAALCVCCCGCVSLGGRLGRLWPIMLCQMGWILFLFVNSFAVFLLN